MTFGTDHGTDSRNSQTKRNLFDRPHHGRRQRSLIWIDDRPLKQQAYREVEKTLKMIEKGELAIERYLKEDQSLYEEWVSLTFRKARESVSLLRDRFRALQRFHNWIIATHRQLDVSVPKAYRLMKEEQERYEKGSEDERAKIEEARRLREAFIEQEIAREFGPHDMDADGFDEAHDEAFGDGSTDDGFNHADPSCDHENGLRPPRDADEEAVFLHVWNMSDKNMAKICRTIEGAREIFFHSISLIAKPAEMSLLLRIWRQCPPRIQKQLRADFRRATGADLLGVIAEAEGVMEEAEAGDLDFDFMLGGQTGSSASFPKDDSERAESLKIAFRRLAHRLHPDTALDAREGEVPEWQKRFWHRAQNANKAGNLKEIEVIFTLTLLRQKAFADLSLSEIQGSQAYLDWELEGLREQTKLYRRSPAWGFSRKRTYTVIERKIQKEIDKERDWLRSEIDELELLHRFLGSQPDVPPQEQTRQGRARRGRARRGRARRTTPGQKSRSTRRRNSDHRSTDRSPTDQMPLF